MVRVAFGVKLLREEKPAAITIEPDHARGPAEPRGECGAEGVGEEQGGIDSLASEPAGDRQQTLHSRAALVEGDEVPEPR